MLSHLRSIADIQQTHSGKTPSDIWSEDITKNLCARLFEWALNNPKEMPSRNVGRASGSPNLVMRMLTVIGDASTAAKLRALCP